MKVVQAMLAAMMLTLLASADVAHAFDYGSFKPKRLDEARAEFLAVAREPVAGTGGKFLTHYVDHGGRRWRARVSYTGRSRPLEAEELAFIQLWLKSAGHADAVDVFTTSYLFTAGGADYWLPVEAQVAAYFPKELEPGDELDLYLAEIGGSRRGDEWLWLPLVEEFEKVEQGG